MGGPCYVMNEQGKLESGPSCTDNFQVVKFVYEGDEWHSVEQCFQAVKYEGPIREMIRSTLPEGSKSEYMYGIDVWRLGQKYGQERRPDWKEVKVEIMYKINHAKYLQNPELQEQLASTGEGLIWGEASTDNWQIWNSIIQMQLRKEIVEGKLDQGPLEGEPLKEALRGYLQVLYQYDLIDSMEYV